MRTTIRRPKKNDDGFEIMGYSSPKATEKQKKATDNPRKDSCVMPKATNQENIKPINKNTDRVETIKSITSTAKDVVSHKSQTTRIKIEPSFFDRKLTNNDSNSTTKLNETKCDETIKSITSTAKDAISRPAKDEVPHKSEMIKCKPPKKEDSSLENKITTLPKEENVESKITMPLKKEISSGDNLSHKSNIGNIYKPNKQPSKPNKQPNKTSNTYAKSNNILSALDIEKILYYTNNTNNQYSLKNLKNLFSEITEVSKRAIAGFIMACGIIKNETISTADRFVLLSIASKLTSEYNISKHGVLTISSYGIEKNNQTKIDELLFNSLKNTCSNNPLEIENFRLIAKILGKFQIIDDKGALAAKEGFGFFETIIKNINSNPTHNMDDDDASLKPNNSTSLKPNNSTIFFFTHILLDIASCNKNCLSVANDFMYNVKYFIENSNTEHFSEDQKIECIFFAMKSVYLKQIYGMQSDEIRNIIHNSIKIMNIIIVGTKDILPLFMEVIHAISETNPSDNHCNNFFQECGFKETKIGQYISNIFKQIIKPGINTSNKSYWNCFDGEFVNLKPLKCYIKEGVKISPMHYKNSSKKAIEILLNSKIEHIELEDSLTSEQKKPVEIIKNLNEFSFKFTNSDGNNFYYDVPSETILSNEQMINEVGVAVKEFECCA